MDIGETLTVEDLDADPYPWYRRLREEEPVAWVPVVHAHLVTRREDVHRVCRDARTFGAAVHDSPLSQVVGANLVHSDGAYHQRLRAPLTAGLRPSAIRRTMEPVVRDTVRALLAELSPGTETDLLTAFARPLSVRVLQRVTGLPELPVEVFTEWVAAIAGGAANYERDPEKRRRADEASAAVDEVLHTCLGNGSLRNGPLDTGSLHTGSRPDTPHTLLAALTATGATFTEVAATAKLLILGGMQEPRDLFGHALTAYLTAPGVRDAVDHDRSLIARLVEEALRFGSPVGTVTRRVVTPTRLAGRDLDAGTLVLAVLASANRDARYWDAPDEFRLDREHHQHLAFSAGAHACMGAMLGRMQVRIALEELLTAFPSLELAGQPVFRGWEFRGPDRLAVRLAGTAPRRRTPPVTVPLRVAEVRRCGATAAVVTVVHRHGGVLPSWTPGAHVDLVVGGVRRSYSLCGDPEDRRRWRFGVRRGDVLRADDVEASVPRNSFALVDAPAYLLVAGGVGITPLLPMARALRAAGAVWRLLYVGREREGMLFADEVKELGAEARVWVTAERGRPDLAEWLWEVPRDTAVYACGPPGMLDDVTARAELDVRVERFGPVADRVVQGRPFRVRLARAGTEVVVPGDRTLLQALERAGVVVPSTCREGICGSCETGVLAGVVEHRDHVLSQEERARGDVMLVCVSRGEDGLTLDL